MVQGGAVMKNLWVALVLLGVSLVLFLGTPAFSDRVGGLTQALSKFSPPDLQRAIEKLEVEAPVPKTGQTEVYAVGDDGDWQAGIPWPEPRFTDNEDGTVTDNLTGLVWMKHASDEDGADGFAPTGWWSACAACNKLKHGEHGLMDGSHPGEWRLATVRELLSLIDYSQHGPALPQGHPFVGVASYWYWSSTTTFDLGALFNYYWAVGLITGHSNPYAITPWVNPGDLQVWCVRGGQ